ncbi:MAG: hypothetical protein HYR88_06030 [Verrucomicrobia bacterium]|nr:hypothetical protein [Verrucomicrobiota bacterium]
MDQSILPRMPLWVKMAFFLGDALLLGVALVITLEAPHPLPLNHALLLTAAVANGAILFVIPFVLEYKATVRLYEAAELRTAAEQFDELAETQRLIHQASGQWQTVQEHCNKAVAAANEIVGRMSIERKEFETFSQQASDSERAHLRLELEKHRRMDAEWLEVLVFICDNVYAIHQAGLRSGQPGYAEQLGKFQHIVRDAVRRVGLTPHEAGPGELFDDQKHQAADPAEAIAAGTPIAETVATGFTFQGQLIRRIIVAPEVSPKTAV